MFCILISKVINFLGYAFCLVDLLLLLFSNCCSYSLCGIWFRFGMAHVSASGDSIASLFISVGIGFPHLGLSPCSGGEAWVSQ